VVEQIEFIRTPISRLAFFGFAHVLFSSFLVDGEVHGHGGRPRFTSSPTASWYLIRPIYVFSLRIR